MVSASTCRLVLGTCALGSQVFCTPAHTLADSPLFISLAPLTLSFVPSPPLDVRSAVLFNVSLCYEYIYLKSLPPIFYAS